jgi:hypothetical protein
MKPAKIVYYILPCSKNEQCIIDPKNVRYEFNSYKGKNQIKLGYLCDCREFHERKLPCDEEIEIVIFCSVLQKEIDVELNKANLAGDEHECELCGSHGGITLSFDCKCGSNHKIELCEW